MAFLVVLVLGVLVIAMIMQGIATGEKRRIPQSYYFICTAGFMLDIFLAILLGIKVEPFNFWQIAIIVICAMAELTALMILLNVKTYATGDEISLQNMFSRWFVKKEDVLYQQFTAKKFASENKIQYVSQINVYELIKTPITRRIISENNKHILFQPLYSENGDMNSLEWYGEFTEEGGSVRYSQILTNQNDFSCITNLNEILLQLMKIYEYSLQDKWFINPYGFALELEEKAVPGYKGKARLLVTDEAIINSHVEYDQKLFYKKKMLNRFLEDFIGANFLKTVTKDPTLNEKLENLKWDAKHGM